MFYYLNMIVNILKQQKIETANTADRRIDSVGDELIILKVIRTIINSSPDFKDIKLIEPPPRHWYDFVLLVTDGPFLPFNIKSSTLEGADNLSCKSGLLYTLTEINPDDITNTNNWKVYNEILGNNLNGLKSEKDYGFLVVNKDDTSDIFASSLRSIEHLTENGSNLPFQCNWGKNRDIISRDPKIRELSYLLDTYRGSLKKSVVAYREFEDNVTPKYKGIMEANGF